MKRVKAPKDPRSKTVIISSLLLLIALPLVIIGATQENLDTRNQAYQEYTVSEENPCVISFPNVNPYTLEVGKSFTILADSEIKNGTISTLNITDSSGAVIYSEEFTDSPKAIASNFVFTPEKSGEIDINGIITTNLGESIACKISSPYDILGANAISSNSAPVFKTSPELSTQILKTEETFEYILTAEDADGDRINYSTSFTPTSQWLRETIIEDGSNGKLTIKFRGSTSKPASYLANIFIHDGYSTHLRSQSWVINVSQGENDEPVITILEPTQSLRLNHGDSFKTKWEAQDLNLIQEYELYFSSNPANEDTWTTIKDGLPAKTTEYVVNTKIVDPGTYKVIAKAIDNQDPEAFGIALSEEIVISATTSTDTPDEPDDIVTLAVPQVTNMSPVSTDEVTNTRVTVKATIIAGEDATLIEENVSFLLDSVNKTADIKINKITDTSYTVIYQTEEDFTPGLHKAEIYFKDSNDQEITKYWTFTIKNDEDDINPDIVNIFGIELAKRTAIIIGIGIAIVLVAILVPVIIFSVWREDGNKKTNSNPKLPPTIPSDDTPYVPLNQETGLRQKVETIPQEIQKEEDDNWDKYGTAKPEEGTLEMKDEYLVPQKKEEEVELPEPMPMQDIPVPTEQQDQETTIKEPVQTPESIVEPSIPEPIQPTQSEIIPEKKEQAPEPIVETPKPTPEPVIEQPSIPEPVIPEPVLPTQPEQTTNEEEAIQQLYSQIQQVQENNNAEENPPA